MTERIYERGEGGDRETVEETRRRRREEKGYTLS